MSRSSSAGSSTSIRRWSALVGVCGVTSRARRRSRCRRRRSRPAWRSEQYFRLPGGSSRLQNAQSRLLGGSGSSDGSSSLPLSPERALDRFDEPRTAGRPAPRLRGRVRSPFRDRAISTPTPVETAGPGRRTISPPVRPTANTCLWPSSHSTQTPGLFPPRECFPIRAMATGRLRWITSARSRPTYQVSCSSGLSSGGGRVPVRR